MKILDKLKREVWRLPKKERIMGTNLVWVAKKATTEKLTNN